MNEQELTYATLKIFFKSECAIAGNTNVKKISKGADEMIRTSGGANFDITAVIATLINAVRLIYDIIKFRKEASFKKNKLEQKERAIIIEKINIINYHGVSIQKKEEICKYILEELEKTNLETE